MKKESALLTLLLSVSTVMVSALTARPTMADEVWTTEEFDVVYQEDRNETAIWTYGDDNNSGTIFIDGLGGVFTGRGSYTGYWTQANSSLRCDTFREGADGEPTYHWGRFEISFLDADFPSRWHAHFGLCDREANVPLNGTPVVGAL